MPESKPTPEFKTIKPVTLYAAIAPDDKMLAPVSARLMLRSLWERRAHDITVALAASGNSITMTAALERAQVVLESMSAIVLDMERDEVEFADQQKLKAKFTDDTN